jgi:hypothetical protein
LGPFGPIAGPKPVAIDTSEAVKGPWCVVTFVDGSALVGKAG